MRAALGCASVIAFCVCLCTANQQGFYWTADGSEWRWSDSRSAPPPSPDGAWFWNGDSSTYAFWKGERPDEQPWISGVLGGFGIYFETAANISAIFFILSPIVDVHKVCRTKGDALKDVNSFNLISMFTNCALWLTYGVLKPLPPAVPCNAVGIVASYLYLVICWCYVARKGFVGNWDRIAALATLSVFALSAGCYFYAAVSPAQAEHVGYLAMAIGVILYGAPLSLIGRVIAEQSSASLPPVQCCLGFCCSFLWLCVGLNNQNKPTIIVNSMGVPLAFFNVALIWRFPRSAKIKVDTASASTPATSASATSPAVPERGADSQLKKRSARAQSPPHRQSDVQEGSEVRVL